MDRFRLDQNPPSPFSSFTQHVHSPSLFSHHVAGRNYLPKRVSHSQTESVYKITSNLRFRYSSTSEYSLNHMVLSLSTAHMVSSVHSTCLKMILASLGCSILTQWVPKEWDLSADWSADLSADWSADWSASWFVSHLIFQLADLSVWSYWALHNHSSYKRTILISLQISWWIRWRITLHSAFFIFEWFKN